MLRELTLITPSIAAEISRVGEWKITDPLTTLPTTAEMNACWDHYLMIEQADPENLEYLEVVWSEALQSFHPCYTEDN